MKFQIGNTVRAVEPKYDGIRFKLIGFDEKQDAILSVTCSPLLLEKIDDEPLKVGDLVEIIGPAVDDVGRKFMIDQKNALGNYSTFGLAWYPASSLRLVEELKVGDLVQIVGPDCMDIMRSHDPAKAYQIHTKTDSGNFQIWEIGFYPASSLRKLTPEEIAKHLAPTKKDLDQIEEKFKTDRRLSTIEGKLEGITGVIRSHGNRLSAIEKRQGVQQNEMPIFSITKADGRLVVDYNGEGMELARQLLGAD